MTREFLMVGLSESSAGNEYRSCVSGMLAVCFLFVAPDVFGGWRSANGKEEEKKAEYVSPYHAAAAKSEWKSNDWLSKKFLGFLKDGEDVRVRDRSGMTPLHLGVERQVNEQVIIALLEAGADVNVADELGRTALLVLLGSYAISEKKKLGRTKMLLGAGADVTVADKFGNTAVHWDLEVNRYKPQLRMVKNLLEAGADISAANEWGVTLLHSAIRHENDGAMNMLLNAGADVNVADGFGLTPLHLVMGYGGSLPHIAEFLQAGADVGALSVEGLTPLHMMARNENFRSVDPADQKRVLDVLSGAGFDVSATDRGGSTPMHYAVQSYNLGMIAVLLEMDSDVNAQDAQGMTPLHWVSQYHSPVLTKVLADLRRCPDKWKPINEGMKTYRSLRLPERNYMNPYSIDYLIGDIKRKTGWTDADRALSDCGNIRFIIDALLERGAEVNVLAEDGSSPLHHAAYYSNLVFVRALLEAGADPNRKMKNGMTPMDYAFSRNKPDYARVLLEAGADLDDEAAECMGDAGAWKECADRNFKRVVVCDEGDVQHMCSL